MNASMEPITTSTAGCIKGFVITHSPVRDCEMPYRSDLLIDLDQGHSTPAVRRCHVTPNEECEMLKVDMDRKAGYLELTVDGRIEKADFERAVAAVDTLLKTHKKIDVLEAVLDVGFVEPDVWWKEIVFHLSHHNFLRRVAVVSDSGWVGPLTRLFAPLYPAFIRTYSMGEIFEARRWTKKGEEKAGDAVEPHLDFA